MDAEASPNQKHSNPVGELDWFSDTTLEQRDQNLCGMVLSPWYFGKLLNWFYEAVHNHIPLFFSFFGCGVWGIQWRLVVKEKGSGWIEILGLPVTSCVTS